MMSNNPSGGGEGSSSSAAPAPARQLSRYESQKRRDWNTFGQYLRNQGVVEAAQCNYTHVLEFMRYLDQFGKTKVHVQGCGYFGQAEPVGPPCNCPLRQAWGSLDALVGRLRAAYEENGGQPETNPFANGAIRVYLREVRDSQAKARGIPYKKKKKKRKRKKATNATAAAAADTDQG